MRPLATDLSYARRKNVIGSASKRLSGLLLPEPLVDPFEAERAAQERRWGPMLIALSASGEILGMANADAGKAPFPQFPPGSYLKTQLLWGAWAGATAAITAGSSGGFFVNRTAVGRYTVSWATNFADTGYAFVGMSVPGIGVSLVGGGIATGSILIETFNTTTAAATDGYVNFLCLGNIT